MTTLSDSLDYFYLPVPRNEPYWTESSWFSFAIPERGINGFFYSHFRPNMNCVLGGPAMWDASGQHVWDFLFFDWQTMRLPPEGRYGIDYNKYDFVTPWGMSLQMIEPLQQYRLGYDRENFELDLIWTAIAEPNIMRAMTPAQLKGSFKTHFEQPGRIRGHITLDGERYEIDCFSIRDGGHGPRFMDKVKPGGYGWSIADEHTAWHALAPNSDDGDTTKIMGGYLLRDGEMAHLVGGTRKVLVRDGPRPIVTEYRALDALGRELHAVGRAVAAAEFMLFPDRGQWWTLYSWDYDGFTGALGEDQEYYGIQEFRRWHRGGPKLWETR